VLDVTLSQALAADLVVFLNKQLCSAVAKRPRDASCLSVRLYIASIVGLQNIERSFLIVIHRLQIYHCLQLNAVLLSLAQR